MFILVNDSTVKHIDLINTYNMFASCLDCKSYNLIYSRITALQYKSSITRKLAGWGLDMDNS